MNLLILGAAGGVGRHLVTQALEAGHTVTAFVRRPDSLPVQHDRLQLAIGDVTDEGTQLAVAMRGQDAVFSAIGRGKSLQSEQLIEHSVPRILSAMHASGVRRLIFTSAIGVGDTLRDAPLFSRIIIRVFLSRIYADKIAGEAHILRSDVDWTLVQPAQLTNGPLTRVYRAGEHLKLRGIPTIGRADVAHFLMAQLDDPAYSRKIATISY